MLTLQNYKKYIVHLLKFRSSFIDIIQESDFFAYFFADIRIIHPNKEQLSYRCSRKQWYYYKQKKMCHKNNDTPSYDRRVQQFSFLSLHIFQEIYLDDA